MKIPDRMGYADLAALLERFWEVSAQKIRMLEGRYNMADGAPVFTVDGCYTARGWTDWTEGFVYGAHLLQFDATGDDAFLESGRAATVAHMRPHLTHFGVHDHGFNNVSTFGALLRLQAEGLFEAHEWERRCYEQALCVSAAVQAHRWTDLPGGGGYIYSFNGPHSLFADTIRSLRALALGHKLGQVLLGEGDRRISLLKRLVDHARTTARFNVYYGEGRDGYDEWGRVAHESIFNLSDGAYRCPNSQQGFSPFTTWTRGLTWILLGYAEELEFLCTLSNEELAPQGGRDDLENLFLRAASAAADFYMEHTSLDGIPYWDTGAPNVHRLGADVYEKTSNPYNAHEPVDSSAAAIACQGLLILARYLEGRDVSCAHLRHTASEYQRAGLAVLKTLLEAPYLSLDPAHEGLLLHSVYHRPNGWDHIPEGQRVPCGESCQWGDYHLREAAVLAQRECRGRPDYSFFS